MPVIDAYVKGPGRFCDKLDEHLENTCHLLTVGTSVAKIGHSISRLQGNEKEGFKKVSTALDATYTGISVMRFTFSLESLLTGKMFFKQEGDGSFKVDPETGKRVLRHWGDIVLGIVLFVARLLNPITWFHQLKIIDLGKHAKTLGNTILAAYGFITTLSFVQYIRKFLHHLSSDMDAKFDNAVAKGNWKDTPENREKFKAGIYKKDVSNILSCVIGLFSFPGDTGVIGSSTGNPVLALTTAALSAASSGFYLIKEWLITS